ncbi:unnamed protein product, partial [Staurois parvus]
ERQVSGPQAERRVPDPQVERQVSGPQAGRRAPDPQVERQVSGPQAERRAPVTRPTVERQSQLGRWQGRHWIVWLDAGIGSPGIRSFARQLAPGVIRQGSGLRVNWHDRGTPRWATGI